MLGNRYSQHSFAQVPQVNMARSSFDRSSTIKDTFDFDYLVPIFVDEVIPGDTMNLTVQSFGRLATQKVPIMDNLYIDYFFFFVPNRLTWDNWERFNGAQDDPGDTTDYLIPTITLSTGTGAQVGSIYDKFGIPTEIDNLEINALPLRAYNLIWNQWFRDQNLQNSVVVNKDDGPDLDTEYTLLKRGKRHDYFTSCLPWPQKGPAVGVDMVGTANVLTNNQVVQIRGTTENVNRNWSVNTDATNNLFMASHVGGVETVKFGTQTGLQVTADDNFIMYINAWREAMAVQSIYELDARGGTRYVEILQSHFNVISPDFRLQRPEYLGGGESRINIHPVAQTAPTSGTDAQGQLASFGTVSSAGQNIGFTKSFVEHGYVIGLACARADITYQQGLNRMWSRQTRFDFFWPKLQEIGEQEVLCQELIATTSAGANTTVFGYQERYAEYRYKPSEIHGEFRSTYAQSIDFWHMAEELSAPAVLNASFIQQNTPIDRALAITGAPQILFDAFFKLKHARPMMTYAAPATVGRF